jgi:hypothetical protein
LGDEAAPSLSLRCCPRQSHYTYQDLAKINDPFSHLILCAWRSSQPIYRDYLVIVIDVYIEGEEVPIRTPCHVLGVVFRASGSTLGPQRAHLSLPGLAYQCPLYGTTFAWTMNPSRGYACLMSWKTLKVFLPADLNEDDLPACFAAPPPSLPTPRAAILDSGIIQTFS